MTCHWTDSNQNTPATSSAQMPSRKNCGVCCRVAARRGLVVRGEPDAMGETCLFQEVDPVTWASSCTIYETRPAICRTIPGMEEQTAEACDALQVQEGLVVYEYDDMDEPTLISGGQWLVQLEN